MKITTQPEADAYFEECVQETMAWGKTREQAEVIERQNLGYYASYYEEEIRLRVERLFRCSRPVFPAAGVKGIWIGGRSAKMRSRGNISGAVTLICSFFL